MAIIDVLSERGSRLPDIYGLDEPDEIKRSKFNLLIDVPVALVCLAFVMVLFVLLVPVAVVRSLFNRLRNNDEDQMVLADKIERSIRSRHSSTNRLTTEGVRKQRRG